MASEGIQQVSEHLCFQLLSSRHATAAPHASPTTSAHVVMPCPACLCLLSHRSSTFVQRWQLEYPRELLLCFCLLAPRAHLQPAPLRLASSMPRGFLSRPFIALASIHLDDTCLTLLSALVVPWRLESEQQRPPWRMHRIRTLPSRCSFGPETIFLTCQWLHLVRE
jgi:hypothetical protein